MNFQCHDGPEGAVVLKSTGCTRDQMAPVCVWDSCGRQLGIRECSERVILSPRTWACVHLEQLRGNMRILWNTYRDAAVSALLDCGPQRIWKFTLCGRCGRYGTETYHAYILCDFLLRRVNKHTVCKTMSVSTNVLPELQDWWTWLDTARRVDRYFVPALVKHFG